MIMAVADEVVEFFIGQAEEADGIADVVAFQSLGPENRIVVRDAQWRLVRAGKHALFFAEELDPHQWAEATILALLENSCPALQPFCAGHFPDSSAENLSDLLYVIQRSVFHDYPPVLAERDDPAIRLIAKAVQQTSSAVRSRKPCMTENVRRIFCSVSSSGRKFDGGLASHIKPFMRKEKIKVRNETT